MPGGTRNIKMSTDRKAEVSEHNQIPIDKDKLKEEQKAELQAIMEAFDRQCLLSYMWQNHLNYPGSSALAITLKATPADTHFKRNNSWSVG